MSTVSAGSALAGAVLAVRDDAAGAGDAASRVVIAGCFAVAGWYAARGLWHRRVPGRFGRCTAIATGWFALAMVVTYAAAALIW